MPPGLCEQVLKCRPNQETLAAPMNGIKIQEGRTQSSEVEAPGGSSGAQQVPVQQEAAPPTSVDGPPENALHQSPPPSEPE
eukprot:12917074-Prorocentrum_lima.AAC.1